MFKKLSLLLLCFTLFFGAFLPHEKSLAANSTLTIAADTVNVRKGPSLSYQLVKQVKKGDTFTILQEKGDWIEIQLSAGKSGWVANWLGAKTNGDQSTATSIGKKTTAEANTDQLRVRSGPGTSFRIVGYLNKGQAVTILETNENWVKVSAAFGEGWVAREYIDSKKNNDTTNIESKSIGTGIVNELLNVRNEPSTSSTVIGKLSKGMSVTVLSQKNNWLEITFDNQKAWVSSEYVQIGSQNETHVTDKDGAIGTVTASKLSVRSSSSLNSSIVGSVSKGQRFTILEEENNWVKIEFKSGKYGWAAGWYFSKDKESVKETTAQVEKNSKITILHNGTNIRKGPTVEADVVARANGGESFPIKNVENDWYEITLANGASGFIAGWLVTTNGSAPGIEKQGAEGHLKYKTIVLDPGHGGIDSGATGASGTLEKELTLRTARLLYDKLRAAGANVILTRSSDSFLPLPSRVRAASVHQADAFVSLHYDSNLNRSVRGMTGYYYHPYQKELAEYLYNATNTQTRLKSRGVRSGDFHVIRENGQKSVLMELGYLSNPEEEMTLNSGQFQENAATGLFNGLARYFKEN
jgi:N-acetylmuramoyl-L-alanine amidase